MIKLTENEQAIFDLLKANRRREAGTSIDEILGVVAGSQKSIIVRMKYLASKLAPTGWIIENASGIGRGNKAAYTITKKF